MKKQSDSLVTGNLATERVLGFAALFYSAVLLVGFVIGLYGFFSLLWMAGSLVERNSNIAGSLF